MDPTPVREVWIMIIRAKAEEDTLLSLGLDLKLVLLITQVPLVVEVISLIKL